MTKPTPPSQVSVRRKEEISAVHQRYANRIKARLSSPRMDEKSARDGIMDCFVSTYFTGLKQGIGGSLGIDASEEHVARITQTWFQEKLIDHGSSFEAPTVRALDRARVEVDRELNFHRLPAELKGVHDQMCSLMLSKAEGALARGATSSGTGRVTQPVTIGRIGRRADMSATTQTAKHRATRPPPDEANASSVTQGLRNALSAYLLETAGVVRGGAQWDELAKRLARLERLFATLRDFE